MNLLRIQYFIETARCENFTEAAKKLYTSQPNLSKQIATLENELGIQLFVRTNRAAHLTRAGRYLYEQIKDVPDIINNAFREAKAMGREEMGIISIGILEGQDVNITLADRFQKLREMFPALEFNLERNSFSNLRKGLEEYRYDLIITLSFELDNNAEDLCYETLIEQQGAIAVSRKNPISRLKNATLYGKL
jgi:DNA-binding transcriptional LysR family regulator